MLSNITQELSTIEISPEIMHQLDIRQIYESFRSNYQKLDDLKKFRTEYERKNAVTRWWHNDKLRDAQLNSAEVQAEFSKTIGQLMVLSIAQSKKLVAQQNLLNNQQSKLQEQANTITRQTSKLQAQHQTLVEHSKTIDAQHVKLDQQQTELKKVMDAYFDLKGLDEDRLQKLVEIGKKAVAVEKEVQATKNEILYSFQNHKKELSEQLEARLKAQQQKTLQSLNENAQVLTQSQFSMESKQQKKNLALDSSLANISTQLVSQGEQVKQALISLKSAISFDMQSAQQKNTEIIAQLEITRKAERKVIEEVIAENIQTLQESQSTLAAKQQEKNLALDSSLVNLSAKAEIGKKNYANIAKHIKRLNYFIVGLSMTTLGTFGVLIHIVK